MRDKRVFLSVREQMTIQAALTFWQSKLGGDNLPAQAGALKDFGLFFEDGLMFAPLQPSEIDSLRSRVGEEESEKASQYRAAAQREYNREGEIEVDENATVSEGDDPGAYVEAWVWVSNEEL